VRFRNCAGPVSVVTEIEARKTVGTGERRRSFSTLLHLHAIRRTLSRDAQGRATGPLGAALDLLQR
jgi:hypothetical protein